MSINGPNDTYSDSLRSGVALTLDIGVIDVTTCQPLPNVMVEVWSRKYIKYLHCSS